MTAKIPNSPRTHGEPWHEDRRFGIGWPAACVACGLRLALVVAFLAAATGVAYPSDAKLVTMLDRRLDGLWDVALVGPSATDGQTLLGYYRNAVRGVRPGQEPKLVVVAGFRDANGAGMMLYGAGSTEKTYYDIVARIRQARATGGFRMTRLTVIGSNAVLQSVVGDRVARAVPFGRDPTRFEVAGRKCVLLVINFHRLPRSIRPDGTNPTIVIAYIKADAVPGAKAAALIARRIQGMTGQRNVRVDIRSDSWFIEGTFPLWYPFEPDSRIPSLSEYTSRGEILCTGDEKRIRCEPMRFPPR